MQFKLIGRCACLAMRGIEKTNPGYCYKRKRKIVFISIADILNYPIMRGSNLSDLG